MTRRPVWLVITFLVVGPALGGLTFMAAAAIADAATRPANSRPILMSIDTCWPIVVTGSYLLGAAPALLSAIGMAIATRWLPAIWQRLLVAPLLGALLSTAVLNLILFVNGHGIIDDWMVTGVVALSGSIAGFACLAIVELFNPLPVPEKAAP